MRLRNAIRAAAAGGAAALILYYLHFSSMDLLTGVTLAATIETAVTERGKPALISLLLAAPVALFALAITTLQAEALLAVVFLAVYARKFGARGQALGLVGFIASFQTLFLQTRFPQLPTQIFALLLAVALAIFFRFVVLPDRPRRIEELAVRAFAAQASELLLMMAQGIRRGPPYEDDAKRRKLVGELDETALWIEDFGAGPELRSRILQWELATGALLQCAREGRRVEIAQALEQVVRLEMPKLDDERITHSAAEYIAAARGQSQSPEILYNLLPPAPPRGQADALRLALQATLAVSVAMILGRLLSEVRWYWAVIASFVIFAKGRNRGEMLVRGAERVVGTALGIVAGMLIHRVVRDRPDVTIALLFLFLILMYEQLRASYTMSVFYLTVAIALLYGALHRFTDGTLVLRLEETAIGACVGMLVALLVLPAGARAEIKTLVIELLRLAADVIRDPRPELARALDRKLRDLRAASQPVHLGMRWFGWHRAASALCRQTLTLGFFARQLLHTPGVHSAQAADRALRIADALEENETHFERSPPPEPGLGHIEETLDHLERTTIALLSDP